MESTAHVPRNRELSNTSKPSRPADKSFHTQLCIDLYTPDESCSRPSLRRFPPSSLSSVSTSTQMFTICRSSPTPVTNHISPTKTTGIGESRQLSTTSTGRLAHRTTDLEVMTQHSYPANTWSRLLTTPLFAEGRSFNSAIAHNLRLHTPAALYPAESNRPVIWPTWSRHSRIEKSEVPGHPGTGW